MIRKLLCWLGFHVCFFKRSEGYVDYYKCVFCNYMDIALRNDKFPDYSFSGKTNATGWLESKDGNFNSVLLEGDEWREQEIKVSITRINE